MKDLDASPERVVSTDRRSSVLTGLGWGSLPYAKAVRMSRSGPDWVVSVAVTTLLGRSKLGSFFTVGLMWRMVRYRPVDEPAVLNALRSSGPR